MNAAQTYSLNSFLNNDGDFGKLIPEQIWRNGGVIEIVLTQYNMGELELMLPTLGRCLNDGQWLAWIAAPYRFTSEKLESYQINPMRLLQIYPSQKGLHIQLLSKALTTGRCGAVVAWASQCNQEEITQLRQASHAGKSIAILVVREFDMPQHSHADVQIRLSSSHHGALLSHCCSKTYPQQVSVLTSIVQPQQVINQADRAIRPPIPQQPSQLSFF